MKRITVTLKDGTAQRFDHQGRAGGSYTIRAEFTEGWVHVENEHGRRQSFPAADVTSVDQEPFASW